MAGFDCLNGAVIVLIIFASGVTNGYKFDVGGEEGWVVNHSDDNYYNNWAQKLRFQVYDTLFFKYKKGEDSVLMVTKGDYDNCNIDNPIYKMDGGDSYFTFDRYGPFYFISGSQDCNCIKGQKLIAVVLAPRPPPPPPSTTNSSSSSSPPPPPPLSVSPSPSPKNSDDGDSNNSTANKSRAMTVHFKVSFDLVRR
ncbi:early nodulin-like protein 2 [Impatiens glandulifera]|uniref:early nodulin-like protein 2 n=1 Tax=Impatiens glandulifera TaxID=253017 RepID=UPI001FB0687D|nr:early nodulin-like protein 2 [Impatiens glandulifera]